MANSIVYETLNSLLDDSIKFFSDNCHHDSSESILQQLLKIQENVRHIEPLAMEYIGKNVHRYDVVPGVQANGYRSLLAVLESLFMAIIGILRNVSTDRSKTFFRGNEHDDKLKLCSDILHQLRSLLYYAQILIELTPNGELFVDEKNSEALMHDCEIMAKACFYGSLHGFQYCSGIQPVVSSLGMFVASYNDVHQPSGAWNLVKSAINSSRYMVSPELRGEKLEKVYNGSDVQFFKKFWSLNEMGIVKAVPNLVGTSVEVNRIFTIQPEPFTLQSVENPDEEVRINFTSSLDPSTKHIKATLISSVLREGQNNPLSPSKPDGVFDKSKSFIGAKSPRPKSDSLLFFCHGGGFIALTSKSFEVVLRGWSKHLDCPVFSVDYSLAPEAPFPEAFEECSYAYAWALKNADMLGTTAENIVFAGDSAGGNLVLSVAMRAGVYGIKKPNSIVAMYPACVVRYSASPARLLSVMDPLLPLGVLSSCLGAYTGVKTTKVKREPTTTESSSDSERPTSPSRQPVKLKFFSNFFKDVGEGFTRMRTNHERREEQTKTWWDDEFDMIDPDEINGNRTPNTGFPNRDKSTFGSFSNFAPAVSSPNPQVPLKNLSSPSSVPGLDFKVELPNNFEPLRSKFCGDSFQMHQSPVVKNAFISPALASDEMMKNLPHVDIVGCEFDPLFDDSVVLAKRLEKIGNSYQFHVVRGLPHGFLSLQIAKEARDKAKVCLELIQKGLKKVPR